MTNTVQYLTLMLVLGIANCSFSQVANQNAASFPGTAGAYVNINNSSGLNPTRITVEAWIKLSASAGGGAIVAKGTGGGGEVWSLDIFPTNTPRFYFWIGANVYAAQSATNVLDNAWHHVAGVYDGVNALVYVDNILTTGTSYTGNLGSNTHEVTIGARQSGSATYDETVTGLIDEVRIWNIARSLAQLQTELYRELSPTNPSGLVAYYKFNGTSGQYNDLSGNGNNGSVIGSVSNVPSTAPVPFYSIAASPWTTTTTWASGQGVPPSTTYTDVWINNNISLDAAKTLRDVTIANSATLSDAGFQLSSAGTLNLNSGTFKLGAAAATTWPAFGTNNITSGTTVEYASTSGAQTVSATPSYANLTFSGAGTKTTAAGTTSVSGNWSTTGGTATLSTNNSSITVTGNITGSGAITSGTGTISLGGNWTNNGVFSAGGGTVNYTNTPGGQTVGGVTYNNLMLSNTANSNTAAGAINVGSTLTTTAGGTLDMLTFALGGSLTTITNNGKIRTACISSPIPNNKTWGGTIEYYGAGGQTVAGGTYLNCSTSLAGNYSAGGNITVSAGGLFDNGGGSNAQAILDMGIFTLTRGSGNIGNNNATIRFGGATNGISGWGSGLIEYYGATGQVIANGNYGCLKINNSNGASMNGDVNVNGQLTDSPVTPGTFYLTSGVINTNGFTLTVIAANSISGGSSLSYISGKLAQGFSAAGSKLFPIGKGGNYRGLTFNYTSFDAANTVTAEQTEGTIPGSSPANTVMWGTRYWTISQSGASTVNYYVTCDGTDFSPTYTAVMIKGDGTSNSSYAATFSSPNYTNTSAFTSFSNFGLGQIEITTTTAPDNKPFCVGASTLNLTATVSPNPGGGTVQFWVNGSTVGTPQAVDAGTGVATLTSYNPSAFTAGSYSIRGDFSGFGNYLANTSNPSTNGTLTVNPTPVYSLAATNVSCKGYTDGQIMITVTTGTSPFRFSDDNGSSWVPAISTTSPYPFTGLLPYTQYKIRVMDSNGCLSPKMP